jgi:hypothetical protein
MTGAPRDRARTTRRWTFLIASGAVVLTTAAIAPGALKESSETFTVGVNATAEGIAACKGNKRVVSGGFSAPPWVEGDPNIQPVDSQRDGKHAWRARQHNFGTSGEATAYAYCGDGVGKLKARSKSAILDPDELDVVMAKCKRGTEAVAGGFDAPEVGGPPDYVAVVSSKRGGKRAWKTKFFNAFNDPREVSTEVYCVKGASGLKAKSRSVDQTEGENESVAAKCKRSQPLISGGFTTEYSDTRDISSFVFASRRSGKRKWEVRAFPDNGNPKLKALAYCQAFVP